MSHGFRLRMPLALRMLATATLAVYGGSKVTDAPGPGTTTADTTKPATMQHASLTVRLTSSRPSDPVRTAVTAADATVRFDNLLEAVLAATTDRALIAVEEAQLAPEGREATIPISC